jgi:hypothetical protein
MEGKVQAADSNGQTSWQHAMLEICFFARHLQAHIDDFPWFRGLDLVPTIAAFN